MKGIFTVFLLAAGIICFLFPRENAKADINSILNSETYHGEFIPNSLTTLRPVLINQPISVDGILDSAWFANASFDNFTEFEPSENKRPDVVTGGYLTYDRENLYIAFVCQDPDISQLRASLTDRDKMYNDDWVCVSIDPYNDQQKAYEFYINARGIQGDRLWQANGTEDESFDLVWQGDASIFEGYWTAEMKIPFESLRFPSDENQNWRIHFIRNYPRENQYKYSWMPISANNNSLMGQAGTIQFSLSRSSSPANNLEVLPYAVATQQSYRIQDPAEGTVGQWESQQPESRFGFGLKYSLSSNLITDFTYNPDFSQIESDAGQISINNPFALFYNEKRPFFQEGSDVYQVDYNSTAGIAIDQYINLFYSRSINDPMMAAKLSGRKGRISFGYTSAYDRNTPFVIPFEERSAVLSTDRNSYSNVLRMKYDLGNRSAVGFILTDRRLAEGSGENSVASLDATVRLSDKYNFSLLTALSHTREANDPELSSQMGSGYFEAGNGMKTAAFDGESFYGKLLRAKLNRDSRHWIATLAFQDFSPGFRADNGFITSNSYRALEYITGYYFRFEQNPVFTAIRPRMSVWRKYNYDGIVKDTGLRTSIVFFLNKQTNVSASAFIFNRENLYGKQFGDARSAWIYVENNTLNAVSGNFFMRVGKEINRLGVRGNPRNPFDIVPSLTYNWAVTFKPQAKFDDVLEYQFFSLWNGWGQEKIRGQRIWRNSFSYQFNKSMMVRLIGEYNQVEYYSGPYEQLIRQKYFSLEPLFSYKMNAFSVFYLGGHIGAQNNFYLNWPDMRTTDQTLFIKFQYLFRSI
ncbi:MAG: DUF5916 domain-containing protein [Calditrichia bacterium]